MQVRQITVVGAGIMGTGITQAIALGGYEVVLYDVNKEAAQRALENIRGGPARERRGQLVVDEASWGLDAAVKSGRIDAGAANAAFARIRVSHDLREACAEADLVIESIYEDLAIKVRTFRQLDEVCPPRTILASNTSGFPIDALAAATERPHKVIGWHFHSPVSAMEVSEIVVHPETDADTRDTITGVGLRIGGRPEIVRDDPFHWGFVANRILFAVLREADAIVADGVATSDQVDRLVKDFLGWPRGPFEIQSGLQQHHYFAGTDPDDPPATMSAAYHVSARARRGLGKEP